MKFKKLLTIIGILLLNKPPISYSLENTYQNNNELKIEQTQNEDFLNKYNILSRNFLEIDRIHTEYNRYSILKITDIIYDPYFYQENESKLKDILKQKKYSIESFIFNYSINKPKNARIISKTERGSYIFEEQDINKNLNIAELFLIKNKNEEFLITYHPDCKLKACQPTDAKDYFKERNLLTVGSILFNDLYDNGKIKYELYEKLMNSVNKKPKEKIMTLEEILKDKEFEGKIITTNKNNKIDYLNNKGELKIFDYTPKKKVEEKDTYNYRIDEKKDSHYKGYNIINRRTISDMLKNYPPIDENSFPLIYVLKENDKESVFVIEDYDKPIFVKGEKINPIIQKPIVKYFNEINIPFVSKMILVDLYGKGDINLETIKREEKNINSYFEEQFYSIFNSSKIND
jgi:hypothetical protein